MPERRRISSRFSRWLPWGMILLGCGLLLLGVVSAFWLVAADARRSLIGEKPSTVIPAKVEFTAPDLSLFDIQGNPVALADYRGKVVLVNNWATWCPPCKAEMPILQAYYEAHQAQDFILIAIDAGDAVSQVLEYVRTYQLSFPVWLDPQMEALRAFRNDALPSSYVIDRQGVVRLAWTGAVDRETLEKFVTPLLEE